MNNGEPTDNTLKGEEATNTNPFQQAYVGPPNASQPPLYTPPNFAPAPVPNGDNPPYLAYPPQPYPPQHYAQYPPQPYHPQQYPNQPYPPQPYPNQPYPAQPYPVQPVMIVHPSPGLHAMDTQQPLPCGGLGIAWIFFILGWFTGLLWIAGAFFACVGDPRERRGGIANLVVLVIWVALVIFVVAR